MTEIRKKIAKICLSQYLFVNEISMSLCNLPCKFYYYLQNVHKLHIYISQRRRVLKSAGISFFFISSVQQFNTVNVSYQWMEDSDKENIEKESLEHQFLVVKNETNTSMVCQFGGQILLFYYLHALPVGCLVKDFLLFYIGNMVCPLDEIYMVSTQSMVCLVARLWFY
jgi:hypothetical protein